MKTNQGITGGRVLRALAAFGLSMGDVARAQRADRRAWARAGARIVEGGGSSSGSGGGSGSATITAIVGPSGAGKTSMLREVERAARSAGHCVVRAGLGGCAGEGAGVGEEGDERAIVEMEGTTLGEAIALLARVGLAEPRLFGLRVSVLSAGQRARYGLAVAIRDALEARKRAGPGGRVWVLVDEFGSGLDVVTARGVASAMARVVRRHAGVHMVVCVHDERTLAWLEPDAALELTLEGGVRERRAA